jgi:hypothetical protein
MSVRCLGGGGDTKFLFYALVLFLKNGVYHEGVNQKRYCHME